MGLICRGWAVRAIVYNSVACSALLQEDAGPAPHQLGKQHLALGQSLSLLGGNSPLPMLTSQGRHLYVLPGETGSCYFMDTGSPQNLAMLKYLSQNPCCSLQSGESAWAPAQAIRDPSTLILPYLYPTNACRRRIDQGRFFLAKEVEQRWHRRIRADITVSCLV